MRQVKTTKKATRLIEKERGPKEAAGAPVQVSVQLEADVYKALLRKAAKSEKPYEQVLNKILRKKLL